MAAWRPYELTDDDRHRLQRTVQRDRIKRMIQSGGTGPGAYRARGVPVRVPDSHPGATAESPSAHIDYLFTKEGNRIIERVYLASREILGRSLFSKLRWEIDKAEGRV